MFCRAGICGGLGMALAVLVSSSRGQEKSLYQRLQDSAVEILVDRQLGGSGCIVEESGLVLTAAHVVARRKQLQIHWQREVRPAQLVAVDLGHDLALLKFEPGDKACRPLPLAERMPAAGKEVFLFGAPLFRHEVLLRGVVGREGTAFEYLDGHYVEVTHIGTASPKGVSGGPWVNPQGELIGLQSGMISLGDAPQGIAFACPLSAVRRLLQQKQSQPAVTLGAAVEELWEQPAETLKSIPPEVDGLFLKHIRQGGPLAGQAAGTILLKLEEKPVRYRDDLLRALRSHGPGDEVQLTIRPPSQEVRTVRVKLQAIPE